MPLRKARPVRWNPSGICDSHDGNDVPPGSMSLLSNLIPDPSTRGDWVCRPGAVLYTAFTSIGVSGQVSCAYEINNIVYGLVTTTTYPGFDQPFAYDLLTSTFIAVTVSGDLPLSQSTAGDWVPPVMASVGTYLLVTHPGFLGVSNGFFGWFDIATPTAPVWSSGNLSINPLTSVPVSVAQYGGRAYYAVGNATVASDVLLPLQATNANQVLTYGDNSPVTAMAGLPLSNQQGGIIQSLMVFKAANLIYQVTGDYGSPGTWAINTLNVATGTLAPNTLVSTSYGLAFTAPDGVRYIDFNGNVSDPIGHDGDGITVPFKYAVYPTRMCAAYNQGIYRVSVFNGYKAGTPLEEYWYDFELGAWYGPHSFPVAIILPYDNTFVVFNQAQGSGSYQYSMMFRSDINPSTTSSYVENGAQMNWSYVTVPLPDEGIMAETSIVESTLEMAFTGSAPVVTVEAQDLAGNILDQLTIVPTPAQAGAIWDSSAWDASVFGGSVSPLSPYQLYWHYPIVSKRLVIKASGQSAGGFSIGELDCRVQVLGYLQQLQVGTS